MHAAWGTVPFFKLQHWSLTLFREDGADVMLRRKASADFLMPVRCLFTLVEMTPTTSHSHPLFLSSHRRLLLEGPWHHVQPK